MTFGFGKKTRRNHHHISLKGRYPIFLQTPLDQSDFQYLGSHTDLAIAEMQKDNCAYVSVPTRAKTVSRWVGETGAKKKLDSTAQQSTNVLLDRPSCSTSSHFSEGGRSMANAALSSVREGLDREGEMK